MRLLIRELPKELVFQIFNFSSLCSSVISSQRLLRSGIRSRSCVPFLGLFPWSINSIKLFEYSPSDECHAYHSYMPQHVVPN